ncbi:MAG TPA: hypothetical protein VGO47_06080 [Chlamydiales bacterium]|nr:hypothetical protein [Chlamydiales bacterium]
MFLTDEKIDAAKQHCAERRNNNRPSTRQDARVPSGSLDDCRDSHNAATNKGSHESNHLYASKANMNMVCRHDKPLFACDVRTPGEQRFYAIALIQALAESLPPSATIGILYDIACQLDRSIAKVCTICTSVSLVSRFTSNLTA